MKIDYSTAPQVYNKDGSLVLMSALKLYAEVLNKDNTTTEVPIGMANGMTLNESRDITYNYVIGNSDPSTPRDLVPSAIRTSKFTLDTVVMYKANLIGLLSEDAKQPKVEGSRYAASIRSQIRPFTIKEIWMNPAVGDGEGQWVYIQSYLGCMIESVQKTRDMGKADWRVLENVDIHYKTTKLVVNEDAINDPSLGNLDLSIQ